VSDDQAPPAIDWIEVGRASQRLEERYGRNAWRRADREADAAAGAGDTGHVAFWRAVSAACRPRSEGD
jgi:hypothetical protein